jgi:hypothetical protein
MIKTNEMTHMRQFTRFALLFFVLTAPIVSMVAAAGDATPSAQKMPGSKGTFEFKPADWQEGKTTWWRDSDGVGPGVAGCHVGADAEGAPNGRMFGEACLPNGLLVETNPGQAELHHHINDTGYPDTFDCNDWCLGTGHSRGSCQTIPAPPCDQSAVCACE